VDKRPSFQEKRIQPRKRLSLRVDARLISEQERIDILAGLGHPDLESEGLALSRPRHGMTRTDTSDISSSGLRLCLKGLSKVEAGSAMTLDLHLPGERRVLRLLGDVIWAAEHAGQAVAGLRFAALNEEGLERLRQVLKGTPEE
jgi:hypothetical protein